MYVSPSRATKGAKNGVELVRPSQSASSYFCTMQNSCFILIPLLCLVMIMWLSFEAYKMKLTEKHVIGYYASGGFTLMTIIVSVRLIYQHISNWNAPHVQKHVVRIIWLLPLYAVESWLALFYRKYAFYIETGRESYESYVLYCFFAFLISLLGEEDHVINVLRTDKKGRGAHTFPFNLCVKPWVGSDILERCRFGVLQYVLVKNLTWLVVMFLQYVDWYEEGIFQINRGYLYICIVNNASQIWALYCLAKFYYIMKEELQHYKPLGKFILIKCVVFATWWQSITINFLAYHTTFISSSDNNTMSIDENHQGSRFSGSTTIDGGDLYSWTDAEIAKGLQDFLITSEMFIASIAFCFYYSHEDYAANSAYQILSPQATDTPTGYHKSENGISPYSQGKLTQRTLDTNSSTGSSALSPLPVSDVVPQSGSLLFSTPSSSSSSASVYNKSGHSTQRKGGFSALIESTVPHELFTDIKRNVIGIRGSNSKDKQSNEDMAARMCLVDSNGQPNDDDLERDEREENVVHERDSSSIIGGGREVSAIELGDIESHLNGDDTLTNY